MDGVIRGANVSNTMVLKEGGGCAPLPHGEPIDQLLEQEREQSYQKGLKDGKKKGYEKGRQEVEAHLNFLQRLSEKLLEEKELLFQRLRPEIIHLCMAICEKLLRMELSNHKNLAHLIDSLLSSLPLSSQEETVHVILATEDFLMMENDFASLQLQRGRLGYLQFHSDPLIERGDLRIETKLGILNCSINRELEHLKTQILQG